MGKPHYRWKQNITVSERLSDYWIRLTPNWGESLSRAAGKSVSLSLLVCDFLLALRSVEATASLPHSLVVQFKQFVDGYSRRDEDDAVAKKTALLIAARLVGDLNIRDTALQQQIATKCLQLGGEAFQIRNTPPPFSLEYVWKQYNQEKGFRLALWESQRIGFVSAYNAYESFLMRCLKVAMQRPALKKGSDERFAENLTSSFGPTTSDTCWLDSRLQLFRFARHTITHAGGRETADLKNLSHPFKVEDGIIQIMPGHVTALLRTIEHCADGLVGSAVRHPSFQPNSKLSKS